METVPFILFTVVMIITNGLNIWLTIVWRKQRKEANKILDEIQAENRIKVPAGVWRNYIASLEEKGQYEICKEIADHLKDVPDDEIVSPPPGFLLFYGQNGLTAEVPEKYRRMNTYNS